MGYRYGDRPGHRSVGLGASTFSALLFVASFHPHSRTHLVLGRRLDPKFSWQKRHSLNVKNKIKTTHSGDSGALRVKVPCKTGLRPA